MSLAEDLKRFLEVDGENRIVLVGIGSPIRCDDAVGLRVIELLRVKELKNILLLSVETVPESYTGTIRDFNPTHVIMIDAAHFKGKPGEGRIIPTQAISNSSVSTHSLPLTIFADFIRKSICAKVALIGVQSVNIKLGEGLTSEVEKGAQKIAEILSSVLK